MKKAKRFVFIVVLLLTTMFSVQSQITVTTGTPVNTLVQNVLVGQGVTVTNVTYSGNANAIGHFTTGGTPSNLGLTEGIILSTGNANDPFAPIGSAASNFTSTDHWLPGDAMLANLVGLTTYDAAVLEFDFIPLSDTIRFRYVFGSEEYHEYVNSSVNDVFAFFVSGPNPLGGNYTNQNIARIPGTGTFVSIDNVNNGYTFNTCSSGPCMNCAYFVDNCFGTSVVYDAFTVVLTAWAAVVPCSTYHLKIAIADAGDGVFDSGVFLEAGSLNTNAITLNSYVTVPTAGPDAIEGCNNSIIEFSLPGPTPVNRVVPFTVGGTATNGVDYQAIPNSVTIPAGQQMTSLTIIPFADGIPEGTETVILNVQTSSCSQDIVTVNILDYNFLTTTGNGSTTICGGSGPVTIGTTPANGMTPYTYAWSHGLGSNQNASVNPTATTTYTVTVTDVCGFTATANVTVTISNSANISISPVNPSICLGGNTNLTATGGSTYNWSTGQTGTTINVSPTTTTTYTVTGTDSFGCSGTASVTVTVNSTLNMVITPSNPQICQGTSTTINASGATNYVWGHGPTSSSVTVSPVTTTTYTVSGTDAFGCSGTASTTVTVNPNPTITISPSNPSVCNGQSISIQAIGANTYSWSNGQTSQSINVSPTNTTTYSVTGTDSNGCSGTASVTVTVHSNPSIVATADPDEICIGNTTTLTASGGASYIWSNGSTAFSFTETPPATTTYSVIGTDSNGCSGTAQVQVTVNSNLTVNITPSNPSICEGNNILLSANSNGTNPVFTWSTSQNGASVTVQPVVTTNYSVDVIDNSGCTGSAQVTVTVNPIPFVDFTGQPLSGCVPITVSFINTGDIGTSLWDFGDGSESSQTNPMHQYSNSGNFTVTLTITSSGCSNTLSIPNFVSVYPKPTAGFMPSSSLVYEDESWIIFTDHSLGASSWFWDFGTGNNFSTEQNPEFTFPNTETYVVWQYVENQWGCRDSTFKYITVKPVVTFYVPNAFSPNDDGVNDFFMPFGNNIDPDEYEMLIFDRWGKQIFKTTNLNTPWDGKSQIYNEKTVPQGVYVYVIKATFNGITKVFEGNVTVVL